MFFDLSLAQTPNAYFLYEPASQSQHAFEPPDACLVFSGMRVAAASLNRTALYELMVDCSLQDNIGEPKNCDLNPLVWSGNQPQKISAAALHGTVPPPASYLKDEAISLYSAPTKTLHNAFALFNASFGKEAAFIDAALFSADGDFIHNFFDCIFLGPYSRQDILPCDHEGDLDCPFYARDEMGGLSRNFTACYGAEMHGDNVLPYTCGSQARRAIIKYFFRDYYSSDNNAQEGGGNNGKSLSANVSKLVYDAIFFLYQNYTSSASRGCLNLTSGKCELDACTLHNGFSPCMVCFYPFFQDKKIFKKIMTFFFLNAGYLF